MADDGPNYKNNIPKSVIKQMQDARKTMDAALAAAGGLQEATKLADTLRAAAARPSALAALAEQREALSAMARFPLAEEQNQVSRRLAELGGAGAFSTKAAEMAKSIGEMQSTKIAEVVKGITESLDTSGVLDTIKRVQDSLPESYTTTTPNTDYISVLAPPVDPTYGVIDALRDAQDQQEAREAREQQWREAMLAQALADAERARQAEERELAADTRAAAAEEREQRMLELNERMLELNEQMLEQNQRTVRLSWVMAIGTVAAVVIALVALLG